MSNAFSKEEKVQFDDLLAGFNDALVLSRAVNVYRSDQTMMARTNDKFSRPMPYIMPSYDGLDMTGNFSGKTQLSVPATIGFQKSSVFELTALEARDLLQEGRLGDAAKQKLASDINVAILRTAARQGSLCVKRTTPASGFDDVAICDATMNELGVPMDKRHIAFSSRDWNGIAGNLAARQTMQGKPVAAYENGTVGQVAGFNTFKLDYSDRLTAAAGVTVTINEATAGNRRYIPKATSTASTGEVENVDNRTMNITLAISSGTLKVGDRFTLSDGSGPINSVHHITKEDTGQPKTFVIRAQVSGSAGGAGIYAISPPIIAADSAPTDAEVQYKNVTRTPANGATLTFLNTVAAAANPFWHQDCLEILPGRYALDTNSGMAVMRGTTDQGFEMVMTKQTDIVTFKTKYRMSVLFGTVMLNPEMAGVILFGQS